MNIKYFKYQDIDDDDVKIEINLDILRVRVFTTTYNYNGEVVSRNKCIAWWSAKNKKKFFNLLKNNIGYMTSEARQDYLEFINKLEE